MSHPTNVGEHIGKLVGDSFDAFDRLPKRLREWLRGCPTKYSAIAVGEDLRKFRRGGGNLDGFIAVLDAQDRERVAKLTLKLYGEAQTRYWHQTSGPSLSDLGL